MTRKLVKQGFLGLGQPRWFYWCDLCEAELDSNVVLTHEGHEYCRACAGSVAPDTTHMWQSNEMLLRFPDLHPFFLDTSDGRIRYLESCNRCLCMLEVVKHGEQLQRRYWRLGERQPRQTPFACNEHPGYTAAGEVSLQVDCQHEYLALGTTRDMSPEAHERYKSMLEHRNVSIEAMFGVDTIDFQYFCFGGTHYWCIRCGLYRMLNPQRESLLPERGTGKAQTAK